MTPALQNLARIQIPVALVLVALIVLDRYLSLGLSTELVALLAGACGAVGVPRLSEIQKPTEHRGRDALALERALRELKAKNAALRKLKARANGG